MINRDETKKTWRKRLGLSVNDLASFQLALEYQRRLQPAPGATNSLAIVFYPLTYIDSGTNLCLIQQSSLEVTEKPPGGRR
jgi:hypothetical protein